jgi:hypothetical protein
VGIGTTTPAGTLDVQGGTSTTGDGLNIILKAQTGLQSSDHVGGAVLITGGNGHGFSYGGAVTLKGGDAHNGTMSSAGSITINGGALVGQSSGMTLTGGTSSNGYGAAGSFVINDTSSGNGGDVVLNGGIPYGGNNAGNVLLASARGNVGIGTTTPTSALHVVAPDTAVSSGAADLFTVSGGANTTGNSAGGISLNAGNANGQAGGSSLYLPGGAWGGGTVTLTGTQNGGGGAGNINILARGATYGSGPGGSINLTAGPGGGSTGGNISLTAGDGNSASSGGTVTLKAGNGNTGNVAGSNVVLNGGTGSGSGAYGNIVLANSGGNVGIGTTTPTSKLEVQGQVRTVASTGGAKINTSAAVDWNNGNAQSMSVDCASTAFTNMLDGGTYILAVTETGTSTCVFAQSGLTFYFNPGNAARTSGQRTVYTFQRIGTDVYVSWIAGFQ